MNKHPEWDNAKLYRGTIDDIENKYMMNCHPTMRDHWIAKRKEMFDNLIRCQLRDFDYNCGHSESLKLN